MNLLEEIQSYLLRTSESWKASCAEYERNPECSAYINRVYRWLENLRPARRVDLTQRSGEQLKWLVWACCWVMYDEGTPYHGHFYFSEDFRYFFHDFHKP